MKKLSLICMVLLLFFSTSGCTGHKRWSRYELCFGLSADSGRTVVSEEQWQQFLHEEIVNRFPDGFTLYPANGYWRSGAQIYNEPSQILMVVAPESVETETRLNAIAQAYIQRFRQEAVLQIRSEVKIEFHSAK